MEIKIPKGTDLVLIQELHPVRNLKGELYEYRPPMLVIGEEWARIDRHQRGIVRNEGQDHMDFTGIVPSADHDDKKHIDGSYVVFGKMKWRHLESCEFTRFCAQFQPIQEQQECPVERVIVKDKSKVGKECGVAGH